MSVKVGMGVFVKTGVAVGIGDNVMSGTSVAVGICAIGSSVGVSHATSITSVSRHNPIRKRFEVIIPYTNDTNNLI